MSCFHLACEVVDGRRVMCKLSSTDGVPLERPVLCFSMLAPTRVVEGGEKIEGLGGFTVIRLEGVLSEAVPLAFEVAFEDPDFLVSNRAWHPQGPYIRHPDGSFPSADMDVEKGVKASPAPPPRLPSSGLALVPAPKSWEPHGGVLKFAKVQVTGAFTNEVQAVNRFCKRRGLSDLIGDGASLHIIQDDTLPADGYALEIGENIVLRAPNATGAFYGAISLMSLRATHGGSIPRGAITDAPRFEWRGFMLDCAREYYPPEAIMKLLDLMALLKLNRFHWHFADDEAFRLEVDCAPELWQRSASRGEGQMLPGLFGGQPGPRGGSYSKDVVRQIVAHAKALHIEVLPEIEVPAHALALTAIYPDLRDPDDTGKEASVQGYARNVVNPAQPQTWALLEPLAREVAGLFPFGHLHLGGDELPDKTWAGSHLVDGYKVEHGLKTHQDVQGHIMARLADHVAQVGTVPCAWQEAADGCTGGIGNDAILFSWTGSGPGLEAARRGYRVVMCPAQHTYFDMAHSSDPDDWGANWAATYALDQTIDWDPVPEDEPELKDRIIGVEGTFWSEFTDTADQFEPMIAPRILGLATMGWRARGQIDLGDLRALATCYVPFLEQIGWTSHGGAIMMDTPPEATRRSDH